MNIPNDLFKHLSRLVIVVTLLIIPQAIGQWFSMLQFLAFSLLH